MQDSAVFAAPSGRLSIPGPLFPPGSAERTARPCHPPRSESPSARRGVGFGVAGRFGVLVLAGLFVTASVSVASPSEDTIDRPAVRLLPPIGLVSGPTRIEVLAIDREIARLEFSIDGTSAEVRKRPPWEAKLSLAKPPREQTISVEAFDAAGGRVGDDRVVVNRTTPPLAVRVVAVDGDGQHGPIRVEAKVAVPRKATLEAVRFYRGETLVDTRTEAPFETELQGAAGPEEFVRVTLTLADGRTVEDVELLSAFGLTDEVEVNLVQLQTLVTTKRGAPVTDLGPEDFEIRQDGEPKAVDRLYLSQDMALVMGVVIDASGSMIGVWDLTMDSVRRLLGSSLGPKDRSFLIDFDTELRLAQPLTGDHGTLARALDDIKPTGGTALFDAILYGLLQYHDEPGRRALVVVTDGIDSGSLADPGRISDVASRLGVPVYVVALPLAGAGPGGGAGSLGREAGNVVHTLKLVTDPSGGRLLRVRGSEGLARAFAQIAVELRSQYVLTYYADHVPEDGMRAVDVTVRGRKDVDVRAVLPLDQVQ